MAPVILLRPVPVEHVTLTGGRAYSRRSVLRRLDASETMRADVREQTRAVRLPDSVILVSRLVRALEVLS
jgi:hypothetical protein